MDRGLNPFLLAAIGIVLVVMSIPGFKWVHFPIFLQAFLGFALLLGAAALLAYLTNRNFFLFLGIVSPGLWYSSWNIIDINVLGGVDPIEFAFLIPKWVPLMKYGVMAMLITLCIWCVWKAYNAD